MTSDHGPAQPVDETNTVPAAAGAPPATAPAPPATPNRRSRWRQAVKVVAGLLVMYLLVAYLVLPDSWRFYAHRHPALEDLPGITYTANGIPGDPINVALIGSKEELIKIMLAAKWYPADPLGLRSDLRIAEDTVLKRPYDAAPVSSLYLGGRKEDLAFEQPVGPDPRHRHHLRLWQTDKVDWDGQPIWLGSAVYDQRVGFSPTTGHITH